MSSRVGRSNAAVEYFFSHCTSLHNIHTVRNIQVGSVTTEELDFTECTVTLTGSKRMRLLNEFDNEDDVSDYIV